MVYPKSRNGQFVVPAIRLITLIHICIKIAVLSNQLSMGIKVIHKVIQSNFVNNFYTHTKLVQI